MDPTSPQAPVISKAVIGRLHNLGNYEHVRYEVTVEIPYGNHAGATIERVAALLDALEPKCPVDDWSHKQARRILKEVEEQSGDHSEFDVTSARQTIARYDEWAAKRAAAHQALGDLPVQVTHTDAKQHWED